MASPDEVRITREPDGETAFIEYADGAIGGMSLKIGPTLAALTDAEVLERFNEVVAAMEELRRNYKHVAIEVPIGQPQIVWEERASQWSLRGDVLRAVIQDGGGDDGREPVIEIDGRELMWAEFGRMLTTFAGWGMRLVIVPDDETHEKPTIRVRQAQAATLKTVRRCCSRGGAERPRGRIHQRARPPRRPSLRYGSPGPRRTASAPRQIFQLEVTLQNVEPPVWRRLLVPGALTLAQLHRVLNEAMG